MSLIQPGAQQGDRFPRGGQDILGIFFFDDHGRLVIARFTKSLSLGCVYALLRDPCCCEFAVAFCATHYLIEMTTHAVALNGRSQCPGRPLPTVDGDSEFVTRYRARAGKPIHIGRNFGAVLIDIQIGWYGYRSHLIIICNSLRSRPLALYVRWAAPSATTTIFTTR